MKKPDRLDLGYNFGYTGGMKTAISIPDALFDAAERVAKRLGLSRSELYQRALARFIEDQDDAAVTQALDQVHADESDGLDPALDAMQRGSMVREDW